MTIRIEITGENHHEIRETLAGLAKFITQQVEAPTVGPADAVVTERPKGRTPKKAEPQTIDHDPEEGKKADVRTGGTGDGSTAGDAVGSNTTEPSGTGENTDGQSDAAAAADEKPAEVDAVVKLTIDELRAYTINNYLNVVTDSLPKRKELYDALLKEFGVEPNDKGIRAITQVPADKTGEFKKLVDEKLAEATKA